MTINEILSTFKTSASNVANKATSIYNENLFVSMTESEKKSARKKLRTINENMLYAIIRAKDEKLQKDISEKYIKFATATFKNFPTADTFANIRDEEKKNDFVKALKIVAKYNK